jgi:hypothetical protein
MIEQGEGLDVEGVRAARRFLVEHDRHGAALDAFTERQLAAA